MKYIDKKVVSSIVGISISTLDRWLADDIPNTFPKGRKLGPFRNSRRMWLEIEIYDWMRNPPQS